MMRADASVYFNGDEFGEPVIYTPSGGTPVTITGVIERNPERDMTASGAAFPLVFNLWIANHATLGVLTVTERLDKVAVPLRVNDVTTREFRVSQVLTQDPGVWQLEIHA